MKLSEALPLFERIGARGGDPDLVVTVQSEGGLGGTPSVAVTGIHAGFDWDSGKVLISTERALTGLSAEDVEAIRASVRQGVAGVNYFFLTRQLFLSDSLPFLAVHLQRAGRRRRLSARLAIFICRSAFQPSSFPARRRRRSAA